jgi:uncharacterized UPF0146 family protein
MADLARDVLPGINKVIEMGIARQHVAGELPSQGIECVQVDL